MGSDTIRCFMVVDLEQGQPLLEYKCASSDRRNFAGEAGQKATGFGKQQQLITEQARTGMIFAETDDDRAYICFVAPDYPERVAKTIVDRHARGVEAMQEDGTFAPQEGTKQSAGCKKAYKSLCEQLATEFEGGDKVGSVMREVDKVKGVMNDNINQAMSNLESAESLNESTNQMKNQSSMFNKQVRACVRGGGGGGGGPCLCLCARPRQPPQEALAPARFLNRLSGASRHHLSGEDGQEPHVDEEYEAEHHPWQYRVGHCWEHRLENLRDIHLNLIKCCRSTTCSVCVSSASSLRGAARLALWRIVAPRHRRAQAQVSNALHCALW
eukprot:SAG22_NODE_680_length_7934_cov_5.365539_6_plen_327_part_00